MAATWPRLTPVQKSLLEDIDKSEYGQLHINTSGLRTAWCLKAVGMLVEGSSNWYNITQRGRDYVRFVIQEKRHAKRRT